jgi:hypothetical protein
MAHMQLHLLPASFVLVVCDALMPNTSDASVSAYC